MFKVNRNHVANAIGGFLVGYGFVAFACFFILMEYWAHFAPRSPDVVHGLIFPHNEHGSISYFSGFQKTSCDVLGATSIPLCFLGGLISPKRNLVIRRVGFLPVAGRWDQDDPRGVFARAITFGSCFAPLIIFVFGHVLITWLNGIGFVSGS